MTCIVAYANSSCKPNIFISKMSINDLPVKMVINTRAVVTVMPDDVYFNYFQRV